MGPVCGPRPNANGAIGVAVSGEKNGLTKNRAPEGKNPKPFPPPLSHLYTLLQKIRTHWVLVSGPHYPRPPRRAPPARTRYQPGAGEAQPRPSVRPPPLPSSPTPPPPTSPSSFCRHTVDPACWAEQGRLLRAAVRSGASHMPLAPDGKGPHCRNDCFSTLFPTHTPRGV